MKFVQWISIILIAIVVANILLLALGRMNPLYFWIIIILAALFAWGILPRIKK